MPCQTSAWNICILESSRHIRFSNKRVDICTEYVWVCLNLLLLSLCMRVANVFQRVSHFRCYDELIMVACMRTKNISGHKLFELNRFHVFFGTYFLNIGNTWLAVSVRINEHERVYWTTKSYILTLSIYGLQLLCLQMSTLYFNKFMQFPTVAYRSSIFHVSSTVGCLVFKHGM